MQSSITVTVTVTMGIYHSFFSELLYTLVKMSTTEYYYDDDIVPMTPEVQIPSAIGLVLLIIIAIGGNALTIAAYLKDRYLNTVYDFYIFNLGVTDLLLSCISMPFYAVYTLTEFTWPFGYGFCKVWMVIDFTLCFESIMIMLILSLDRLLMITMGSAYMIKITKVVAWVQIVISWSISFLVYGPAIIGWNYWVGYSTVEKDDCDVEFAYDHMYTTATSIVEFVLPFVCLTFINCLIYIKIRKRIRVSPNVPKTNNTRLETQKDENPAENDEQKKNGSTSSSNHLTVHTHNQLKPISKQAQSNDTRQGTGSNERQVNATRQAKAAKFLAMLVGAFLFFWAPYIITTMAISFCDECINTSLYEFFNWLLWMKSAVNPFLYAYNSPRYRAHFQRYLTCNGRITLFGTKKGRGNTPTGTGITSVT